jgi:hypothetical protein
VHLYLSLASENTPALLFESTSKRKMYFLKKALSTNRAFTGTNIVPENQIRIIHFDVSNTLVAIFRA